MALSILIKHFAVIFLPFILINLFFSKPYKSKMIILKFLKSFLSILSLFIMPFLIWNPTGFIYSIGFSITRATTFPLLDDAYKFIFLIVYIGIIFYRIG